MKSHNKTTFLTRKSLLNFGADLVPIYQKKTTFNFYKISKYTKACRKTPLIQFLQNFQDLDQFRASLMIQIWYDSLKVQPSGFTFPQIFSAPNDKIVCKT